jgi:hypothetical protein
VWIPRQCRSWDTSRQQVVAWWRVTHAMIPTVFSVGLRPYSRDVHPPRLPPPTKTLRSPFVSSGLGLSYVVMNVTTSLIILGNE